MKRAVKRIIEDERGHALELVLILLTMGGLVLSPLLGLMSTGLVAGQVYEKKTQEYYAADAGVEDAIVWLLQGREGNEAWEWYCGNNTGRRLTPIYINDRSVNVTLESLYASNTYRITSVATGPQGSTAVLCTLFAVSWMKGDLNIDYTWYGNAYVDGNVTIQNPGGQIIGDLVTTGNVNLENQTNLSSNVSVYGNATLQNNCNLNGNLCVAGDVILGQSSTVTGDISVEGDLTLANGAKVYGNVFVTGDIKIEQNADIVGNIYGDGDTTISFRNPNASVVGNVCDSGNITISFHNRTDNQITGSVNATGTVTVNYPEDIKGGICQYPASCSCTYADRPPCPSIPEDPLDIYTWQIV